MKKGYKLFGDQANVWARIKEHFNDILTNRTGVQIKDKWRTIQKQKK